MKYINIHITKLTTTQIRYIRYISIIKINIHRLPFSGIIIIKSHEYIITHIIKQETRQFGTYRYIPIITEIRKTYLGQS